jgi:chitin synthase
LSKELFWQCQPRIISFWSWAFWLNPQTWIWLGWLLAQFWVSIHLWTPKHERLARSEKLFVLTYYNSFFIDQTLAFNRRRDDKVKIRAEVSRSFYL